MRAAALTVALLFAAPSIALAQAPDQGDLPWENSAYNQGNGSYVGGGEGGGNRFLPRMPQTCYQPRYGCYYSNERHMNRYPAFHGYYYRRPYNYRNLFDYPWHARLHEPTSLFSYNVPEEEVERPAPEGPPVPPPDFSAGRTTRSLLKRTSAAAPLKVEASPLRSGSSRRLKQPELLRLGSSFPTDSR